MKVIFIRHGKTLGNLKKRYIGKTDEPLCEVGRTELSEKKYPDCDIVFASSMKRCIQTAEFIYPDKEIIVCDDFRECDFGSFEGKNYTELSADADYQKWIDSGGSMAFPGGENPAGFRKRCISAFENAVSGYGAYGSAAFVVHGGTIMSVLERYAVPEKSFYDYQVSNGSGFIAEYDGKNIVILSVL